MTDLTSAALPVGSQEEGFLTLPSFLTVPVIPWIVAASL